MSFKPIEPKRDEFRKYLERCGIIEALTKVFCKLIDEGKRPENPLEYIKEHLGDAVLQSDNISQFHIELELAKIEIQKLRDLLREKNVEMVNISNNEDFGLEASLNGTVLNKNVDNIGRQSE